MAVRIEYKESVEKDFRKIDSPQVERIMSKIERVLKKNPDSGEALKGRYKGLLKMRVGDYRIIYSKTSQGVLIVRVRHRKHAY